MHRLTPWRTTLAVLVVLTASAGCGQKKPADSAKTETTSDDGGGGKGDDTSASGDGKDGGAGEGDVPKKDECVGFDISNVEDLLTKSSCEEPNVKPDGIANTDLKGKLEVTASTSTPKVPAGGKAEVVVTFANKSKDPLTLHFKIDPVPHFSIEVYDKKAKRADMPTGNPPPPPKGATQPPPSEAKTARLTIAPNGAARVRMTFEAVKMKWAPEKFKGTPPERGFPRTAAGPLPKGKYTIRVMTPLVGVFEGVDHEISAPKVEIEVGG